MLFAESLIEFFERVGGTHGRLENDREERI
jgi:hypothetical protein